MERRLLDSSGTVTNHSMHTMWMIVFSIIVILIIPLFFVVVVLVLLFFRWGGALMGFPDRVHIIFI